MKVISRGSLPEDQLYRTSCSNCKSVLEYQKKEASIVTDRNEVSYVLVCPVCSHSIYISSQALIPSTTTYDTDFRDRPYNPK